MKNPNCSHIHAIKYNMICIRQYNYLLCNIKLLLAHAPHHGTLAQTFGHIMTTILLLFLHVVLRLSQFILVSILSFCVELLAIC